MFRYVMSLRMRDSALRGQPIRGAMVAAQDPTHATGALPHTFSDPESGIWHRYPVTTPFEQLIARLNVVQPEVLTSYPSVLRQMKANGSRYLLLKEYTGTGATREQFIKTFATADRAVIFFG